MDIEYFSWTALDVRLQKSLYHMYTVFCEQQAAGLERLSVRKRTRTDTFDSDSSSPLALAPSLRPSLISPTRC